MSKTVENYYSNLLDLFDYIRVTDRKGDVLKFYQGIEMASKLIVTQAKSGHKIMFIGNGASAAISSHMSSDFSKNGGIRSMAFNDPSLLTCISNDFGYKQVFKKSIEMFADKQDILFAISSSGKSENILQGASAARLKRCKLITLSGFDPNNPLSRLGDFNFYVPSHLYGHVEVIHHSICHCILDVIIQRKIINNKKN